MVTPSPHDRRPVLVVSGDPLLRELLVGALEHRGLATVGAGSPGEALRTFRAVDPAAVVMDIDLGPGPTGFDVAESMRAHGSSLAIVFLADDVDPRFGIADDGGEPGVVYLSNAAARDVDALVRALDVAMAARRRSPAVLTRRQVDVLRLVALGKSNEEVARMRGTTVQAAERTVARAFAVLGVDGDVEGQQRVDTARRCTDPVQAP